MIFRHRYYYGGALKFPVRISQEFWDDVTKQRKELEEYNKEYRDFFCTDTSIGNDDLGERPKIPDWFVNLIEKLFFLLGIIGWAAILAFLLYSFRKTN